MSNEIDITVENKLVMEKRYLNVYRSKKSAYIISYNRSRTLSLGTVIDNDYIHITPHIEFGDAIWEAFLIDLPSWADFEFLPEGKTNLIHSGKRTFLKISSGPPTWQLKIIRPLDAKINQKVERITIGDDSK